MLKTNADLINHLKHKEVLKSPELERAIGTVDRKDFVPSEFSSIAYEDRPLPIGHGQTISQPYTVVYMLELLGVKQGEKVLDVGSGSAWTTALLASLVGESGKVIGVEIIPELMELGKSALIKFFPKTRAEIFLAGAKVGYPAEGPYDKILVSATSRNLPEELIDQLQVGGVIVLPIKNSVWKYTRKMENFQGLEAEEHPGFVFVPLV